MPKCKGDTRSVVGKAVARTVSDYFTFCQNFVSTVSVFTTDCDKIENRKGSEISTVQQVIRALDVQGEVFLLMHSTVKKTLELTVSTANHSIVQVKGNQKLLLKQIRKNTADDRQSIDFYREQTGKRGRTEIRSPFIYKNLSGIPEQWKGLNRFIRVARYVSCKKQQRYEAACYISDIRSGKASLFAKHIRNHWGIENRLHYVKDVIMKEDESGIKTGMSAENIPMIRNIVCNLFRSNGFYSIKYAIELDANNFKKLFELINIT